MGRSLRKILPPLFYIVTARILIPEDFGVVATSAMVVSFAAILWEAGLSKALIQSQDLENLQKMSNIVFYTNLALSVILYLNVFIFSDLIASFFHENRLVDVLKLSGLSILLGAAMSVQTALLQKSFEFKKLFITRLVSAIIPGIVSVILAFNGYGYWALVVGTVISMALQAVIIWNVTSWRPTFEYDINVAKKMFHFSKWVLLSSFLSWFFTWGDTFVVGHFFTSHELGLYRTGNYFVTTVIGLVTVPILPVMYSYFSQIQHDMKSVKKALLISSKGLTFFVLPIAAGMYILQDPISAIVFGEKWIGLASIIGYLSLMHGISWIIGLNNSAYLAIGRPDIESKILVINLVLYSLVYMLSARIGFHLFLYSRLMLALCSIFIHIKASKILLDIGFIESYMNIKYVITVTVLFLAVHYFFFNSYIFSFITMFFVVIALAFIYLISMYFLDKGFLIFLKKTFKK